MPPLILGFFATIIIVNLAMAVFASRSWTGFVVRTPMPPTRNSIAQAERGGHTRSDRAATLQSQVARSAIAGRTGARSSGQVA
ncbi:hypothetical protein LHFGNBLO_006555 (plasmid) [Mesorhizobium sp. AR10]|nr:hypothetical protein LHFGNBLO_006555 [Mesorhizobium sp. AR10]